MLLYFLKRLALTIPTFIALMFVTFVAIRLVPGDPPLVLPRLDGEEGGYVTGGAVRAVVAGKSYELTEGDAIHYASDEPRNFQAAGDDPAEFILITTWKLKSAEVLPVSSS